MPRCNLPELAQPVRRLQLWRVGLGAHARSGPLLRQPHGRGTILPRSTSTRSPAHAQFNLKADNACGRRFSPERDWPSEAHVSLSFRPY
jgi:hypothetical protein